VLDSSATRTRLLISTSLEARNGMRAIAAAKG
jgi:hypothetical protein